MSVIFQLESRIHIITIIIVKTISKNIFSFKYLKRKYSNNSDLNKKNTKYVLAVIIKVLQNSPSKIWYHLDNNEYLNAAM